MYLRTTKRKNKDGSVVEYYQLAHNERHPITGKPVARIIHNFGRVDQLDRNQLVRLCRSIARVCRLTVIDPCSADIRPATKAGSPLPEGLEIDKTVTFGTVLLIEALWEKIGLKNTLSDIAKANGAPVAIERALLVMTANKLCKPASRPGQWDQWLETVYLPSCKGLKLQQMYDALDSLYDHAAEVEKNIFFHTGNLFNLKVDLIFYDTTTAFFTTDNEEVGSKDSAGALRWYGDCEDGDWSTQVVVALAVTREGIPLRSWVFPGSTADATMIEQVRAELGDWSLGRALFVADSGADSETVREKFSRLCDKYLLACCMIRGEKIKRNVLSKRGRYTVLKGNVQAKEVTVDNGKRSIRHILFFSPVEAERQRKQREETVAHLEREFECHTDRRATRKWAIKLLASSHYKHYLKVTKSGCIRIDRGKVREASRCDGKWVLETNDDAISLEDAACAYEGLVVIERCFQSLKHTQIKMTPSFRWFSRRIESYVKICVLALMIERVAERVCNKSWPEIRRTLEALQVTKFFYMDYDVWVRNGLTPEMGNLLKKMSIAAPDQLVHLEKKRKSKLGST